MKIAVFSTKPYDREYLDKFNIENEHELIYFDAPLNTDTTNLAIGFEGVCIFVNDKIYKKTIDKLSEIRIKLIDLRCAGFNNVDIEAATKQNIKVTRVPAYSPQAVAEHAVALILTLNRKTHKACNRVERLMAFHNVLITPHQGFFTNEALDQIAQTTLKNFTDFENRLPLENEVKL